LVSQQVAPIAVVSGGGTGMGKAIAAWLVCDGHHVIIIGRWARVLEAAAEELSAGRGRFLLGSQSGAAGPDLRPGC
jgi:NADP-dependent 3-hydroxy acid dehydrogenase YdfG